MARTTWTNGGPAAIVERLKGIPEELLERGGDIVGEVVEQAAVQQVAILRAATTRHGQRRMERGQGNGPGRNDTGTMIEEISHRVRREGNTIIGEWGWDDPEGYFGDQDRGTDRIPAANSLFTSFIHARERLWRAIGRLR